MSSKTVLHLFSGCTLGTLDLSSLKEPTPALSFCVQIAELLKRCRLDIELRDSRQHVKCLRKISRIQHRESVASEKSVFSLSATFGFHLTGLVCHQQGNWGSKTCSSKILQFLTVGAG